MQTLRANRPAGACTILLVEDNDDARLMLARTLELDGFTVVLAADGREALEQFQRAEPDVAVIDIGLPIMDGYEVARQIRSMPECSSTLLIALTGYGRLSDQQAALEAGFDAHLVKPLNPSALNELILARTTGEASP